MQAKTLCCIDRDKTVDILRGTNGVEAEEPETIPQFYNKMFRKKSDSPALHWKDGAGQWKSMTYAEYKKLIYDVAKSFIKVFILVDYNY